MNDREPVGDPYCGNTARSATTDTDGPQLGGDVAGSRRSVVNGLDCIEGAHSASCRFYWSTHYFRHPDLDGFS